MKFKPVLPEKKDPLHVLKEEWSDCTKCILGKRARSHVLYEFYNKKRKNEPVDIMFIGEGPGLSEDVIGRPFIGKAGRCLRNTIYRANPGDLNIVLTNLVACRPQNHFAAKENRDPQPEEINACFPRLESLLQIFEPIAIVACGKLPEEKLLREIDVWQGAEFYHIWHPSFVERHGGVGSRLGNQYLEYIQHTFDEIRRVKENETKES